MGFYIIAIKGAQVVIYRKRILLFNLEGKFDLFIFNKNLKNMFRILFLLFTFISTISFGQSINFNSLDNYINILEENKKLMGALTITRDNNVVFNKTVGYAGIENSRANTSSTKFRIGSVTKTFTAVMIFQMIDEGKLSLSTKLSEFFPNIENASQIQIANLLNHSSGLFNITSSPKIGEWIYQPTDRDTMISRIQNFESNFKPGTETAYSNTNYILLGYIIELIDKTTYTKALKHRITAKIGLENTYLGKEIDLSANESFSYLIEDSNWNKMPETNLTNPGGAGAIVSNSDDLTQFMNALFNGRLISETSLEAMKKTENGEFCHGLFYTSVKGLDIYASEGGIDGFQAAAIYIPKTKISAALTANALDYSKMQIMLAALSVSHGEAITKPEFD